MAKTIWSVMDILRGTILTPLSRKLLFTEHLGDRSMNSQTYLQKQLIRRDALLHSFPEQPGIDRDIWNLEYMLTEIRPGSLAWRKGYVRSLRRAIRALEREKKEEKHD